MDFGWAIQALKNGSRVAREGWNEKSIWLCFVDAGQWQVSEDVAGMDDPNLLTTAWIAMKTLSNEFVPWVASQSDILAEDWTLVE